MAAESVTVSKDLPGSSMHTDDIFMVDHISSSSTNASTTRTALSVAMNSSSDSGNRVTWCRYTAHPH